MVFLHSDLRGQPRNQFGEQVRLDRWEGEQAGVGGTPSFLINGQLLEGAQPFEAFQEMIEK